MRARRPAFGEADYLLHVDGRAAGIVEARREGATLTGVEVQSGTYAQGLPASLLAWHRPLPFIFESTGAETHFTIALDSEPRARNVFAFNRPEMLAEWLAAAPQVFSPKIVVNDHQASTRVSRQAIA